MKPFPTKANIKEQARRDILEEIYIWLRYIPCFEEYTTGKCEFCEGRMSLWNKFRRFITKKLKW